MQNDQKSNRRRRQNRSVVSSAGRSQRGTSNAGRHESKGSLNAQRNYEQYLSLARAQAQAGDTIGAETYYQYAEHYFRSMSSDRDRT
jgi:hypothetical protein